MDTERFGYVKSFNFMVNKILKTLKFMNFFCDLKTRKTRFWNFLNLSFHSQRHYTIKNIYLRPLNYLQKIFYTKTIMQPDLLLTFARIGSIPPLSSVFHTFHEINIIFIETEFS